MKKTSALWAVFILCIGCISAMASEVAWSRFRGKVKKIDGKKLELTIQNKEGDDVTVKIDGDVLIVKGKDDVKLAAVQLDDQVTLMWMPKAPVPKEQDEAPVGSPYPQERR